MKSTLIYRTKDISRRGAKRKDGQRTRKRDGGTEKDRGGRREREREFIDFSASEARTSATRFYSRAEIDSDYNYRALSMTRVMPRVIARREPPLPISMRSIARIYCKRARGRGEKEKEQSAVKIATATSYSRTCTVANAKMKIATLTSYQVANANVEDTRYISRGAFPVQSAKTRWYISGLCASRRSRIALFDDRDRAHVSTSRIIIVRDGVSPEVRPEIR